MNAKINVGGNLTVGSISFGPLKKGDSEMTYDLARKVAEFDAWDRLANAIEAGDKAAARAALVTLRKAHSR